MYKALVSGCVGISIPLPDEIKLAARHGFEGLAIEPGNIERYGIEEVNDLLDSHGLMNAGFGLGVNLKAEGEEFEQELIKLKKRAVIGRKTGATRANYWLLSSYDTTFEETYDNFVRKLRPCVHILSDEGISLALEFIGTHSLYYKAKYKFIRTMPEMLRLCDSIDSRYCGVLLDAHHLYTAGESPDDVLNVKADRIVLVHINDVRPGIPVEELPDGPRLLPGESGIARCDLMLKNLRRIGYEGPVAAEPFYEPFKIMTSADEIASKVMESMKLVWPNK